MKKVSWNPMLNFISEIKTAYRKKSEKRLCYFPLY